MKLVKKYFFIKRIKVESIDFNNLPKTPMLIIVNHKSNLDSLVVYKALYGYRNLENNNFDFVFLAKQELNKKWGVITNILELLNTVFLDRNDIRKQIETFNKLNEHVKKHKRSVIIFPEGHRFENKEFGEFKPGSLKIAYDNFINILPICIYGTGTNKSKDKIIRVKALKPIKMDHNVIKTTSIYLMEKIKENILNEYLKMDKKFSN